LTNTHVYAIPKVEVIRIAYRKQNMYLILKRDWEVIDASKVLDDDRRAVIKAGRYEVERIPNPLGHKGTFWLVLKGTLIGATEGWWRDWGRRTPVTKEGHPNLGKPIDLGEFEIVIED
jgi:hypothetical protein